MLHSLRSPRLIALMCVFCIASLLIVPAAHAGGVVGNGTPASCSEAAFTAALAGGGQITFNCGPNPHTIVLTGARDIAANTVIDGGGLVTLSGGTTTRLFTVKAANNAHLTVRNLTLRDAGGPAVGAIYVEQSGSNRGFFTAVNVSFHDNRSGGIWSRGTVTIDQATFDGHAAPAISNETTGVLSVQHSTFSNNVTINDDGGAIFNQGQATISHSSFTGNGTSTSGSARSFDGAGLYNDGEATVTRSVFSHNTSFGAGGAIYTRGTLTVENSTFHHNRSIGPGGAIAHLTRSASPTSLTVTGSTFYDNEADDEGQVSPFAMGGAIHVETDLAQATIRNSTLAGNRADKGGGGLSLINKPDVTLLNVTIADNVSPTTSGDNIEHRNTPTQPAGTLTVQNSLIVGGTCSGPFIDAGHNMQDPGGSCVGTANNPLLDALQDNGGWTWTRALAAGSPARNAANNAACPPTDQRAVLRPQDAACDIGAVEYGAAPVLATIDPTSILTLSPEFTLTATGSNFIQGAKQTRVLWNGTELNTTFIDAQTLRAQVPAAFTIAGGEVSIKLLTPVVDGGESAVTRIFTVIKRDQTITFAPLPDRDINDPPFTVSAGASSGLPVSFTAAGVCSVSGNMVTLAGTPGTCTISAQQPGSPSYNPAPDVSRTFNVIRLSRQRLPLVSKNW